MLCLYTELKGWQGLIGSLMGFGSLIAGALFNSQLNRKRDKLLRQDEMIAVASALYGEILVQRRSVAYMANAVANRYWDWGTGKLGQVRPFDKHFIEWVSLPPLKLYPALEAKIGMLPSDLVLEVVMFYAHVEQAKTWLPKLVDDPERPFSYGIDFVLDPSIKAVEGSSKVLQIIESISKITQTKEIPNITRAREVLKFELERRIQADQGQFDLSQ